MDPFMPTKTTVWYLLLGCWCRLLAPTFCESRFNKQLLNLHANLKIWQLESVFHVLAVFRLWGIQEFLIHRACLRHQLHHFSISLSSTDVYTALVCRCWIFELTCLFRRTDTTHAISPLLVPISSILTYHFLLLVSIISLHETFAVV